MLPKVASQLFHHTSRAVAVVQNQTGYTLRNVLQSSGTSTSGLGPWNGAGSSSSGWGGSGPGAGGAKFSGSSRYHTGYTGPGRAVTQADPSSADVGQADCTDDGNENNPSKFVTPGARGTRLRSLSLSKQQASTQLPAFGVLKVVQTHVRSRHAFAKPPPKEAADIPILVEPVVQSTGKGEELAHPSQDTTVSSPRLDAFYEALAIAARNGSARVVHEELQKLRATEDNLPVSVYNNALESMEQTRKVGEPLTHLLEAYNEMLTSSIIPNFRTYSILITALTERDHEIQRTITKMETRMRRRAAAGASDCPSQLADQQRISRLLSENNFGSALTLFQAASLIPRTKPTLRLYCSLLRSCAYHGNVDAAIHVYSQLERREDIRPSAEVYSHLINSYAKSGDVQGAEEVFDEFRKGEFDDYESDKHNRPLSARQAQIVVWNNMISAYFTCGSPDSGIGLLEQMMDSTSGLDFGRKDVPLPASSTFSRVIAGFCQSGDVNSALVWFDRLLQQPEVPEDSLLPMLATPQPDVIAWNAILEAVASAGMISELNRLFSVALQSSVCDSDNYRFLVLGSNLHWLSTRPATDSEDTLRILDFLTDTVLPANPFELKVLDPSSLQTVCQDLLRAYVSVEALEKSVLLAERITTHSLGPYAHVGQAILRTLLQLYDEVPTEKWSLQHILRFASLCQLRSVSLTNGFGAQILHLYSEAREGSHPISLSPHEWDMILNAYIAHQSVTHLELEVLLSDLVRQGVDPTELRVSLLTHLVEMMVARRSFEEAKSFLQQLGPGFDKALAFSSRNLHSPRLSSLPSPSTSPSLSTSTPPSSISEHVVLDPAHSRFVDEYFSTNTDLTPLVGYKRFEEGLRRGVYPNPEVLARLIGSLGRRGEKQKVHELYEASQQALHALERNKQRQSIGWFQVEDQMVIALAHCGDTDGAHVHRGRILSQGGTPSPDAYGALIRQVKDTTDDTANATTLYQEALLRGVIPNIYLYNTMISKLAKARKADHALELFHDMKARGIRPSSVTYGAVIAACCRVGDAQSAELLFQEMSSQSNFKPRVPPYNTMIQLYAHTKPDRERALFYYDALQAANVQPTAHTYKLLIDAYGTIEPVDTSAMEDIFQQLVQDPNVAVQGTHWAALINAWGCVRKDLDKAISIFDSIAAHPANARNVSLPDAVCFEALMNVLVTLRRGDLIPVYRERLSALGIHMTAYIANLFIKGYAAVGDLEQAREVFEHLEDPPQGVAAPNNHAVHDPDGIQYPSVPSTAPVYREPSTWEAMVRAELGHGHRDRAVSLLERVQERGFPAAVYNRISGIMLDDAVAPWAAAAPNSA
ncbi:hypothetical protein C8Q75DRAFT_278924 [Abortiporus biennis]|nr:hypothetical protein C8Q75DRAFT_278924 [Abortiporus biennis]